MAQSVFEIMRSYPQIVVFLALAAGYALGKIKFFGFSLGATTCVLLSSLVLGQIGIEVPQLLKSIAFALFIFTIGYKVGPQFFGALKKDGIKFVALSLVVALTALVTAVSLAKALDFDKGTAAGFFAGSVTESAAIGTAEGAIKHLSLTDGEKKDLDTNLAVAYAITYIFGTAGGILFFKVAPRLLGIDLKKEAKKLEASMSGQTAITDKPELFSWAAQLDLRAYRVTNPKAADKTVSELESLFSQDVVVEKVKHDGTVMDGAPDMVIRAQDTIVLAAKGSSLIGAADIIGPETDAAVMSDMIGEILDICVLNRKIAGKTLGELSKMEHAHGLFLRRITRQGEELPITRDTKVHVCDIIQLIGEKESVEKAVKAIGYAERPSAMTDMITVGIGCVLGTLLGLIVVPIAGIPLTLGVGGGVLLAGLILGWLRAVHPTFGQFPNASQWILSNLGLNLFIACVGLGAGPQAVHAFATTGLSVFLAGIVLCLMPFIVGLYFGKYILRMNPVLLLGALTGARVITAALNTVQDDAESSTPVLGYAAPYAFGNVLLTIWGSVIINIM
ncbi:MAG: aspartate-alanine antiporter [Thermodesulfovibrionales bacterium]|nr:aspartate-alanine antiporter [Thermodesulfovibrionales bacterium]